MKCECVIKTKYVENFKGWKKDSIKKLFTFHNVLYKLELELYRL